MDNIVSSCAGLNLMLACRQTNSATISLLAWASRDDVMFQTKDVNPSHIAEGTSWYFDQQSGVCSPRTCSWGFARAGDPINRANCDLEGNPDSTGPFRLCWHTAAKPNGGWRCGSSTDLDVSSKWEKLIFHISNIFVLYE